MAEGARLESVYAGNRIEGSNPSPSAIPAGAVSATLRNPRGSRNGDGDMSAHPADLDSVALGEAIRSRRLSPVEATDAFLERIAGSNEELRAYVSVYPERARAAAAGAASEIAAGEWRGPLHGVPVAVKDLFAVAGMTRTCGSGAYEAETCAAGATAVARLERAGAVVLGMANLHEFAFGATGINRTTGTARNPWDRGRSCGGSSSGSACAVAAGLAAAALGTDTGGSIRVPASVCGIVGFKQSYGLASRAGIFPLCRSLDHGGPFARSVRGAAIVLDAISGADPADPTTRNAPRIAAADGLEGGVAGLRVGVPDGYFFEDLHPEVGKAVDAALGALDDLGAVVSRTALPFDAQAAGRAWNVICMSEASVLHGARLRERGAAMGADLRDRLRAGARFTAGALVEAQWARDDAVAAMAGVMERFDILALPATPVPAVDAETGTVAHEGKSWDGVYALGRFTRLASLTGLPAVSLPCGFTSDGLPAGLQLIGDRFADAAVLRAAHAYEQATPWHTRRPGGEGIG